jgi:hypothetical protein
MNDKEKNDPNFMQCSDRKIPFANRNIEYSNRDRFVVFDQNLFAPDDNIKSVSVIRLLSENQLSFPSSIYCKASKTISRLIDDNFDTETIVRLLLTDIINKSG